MRESNRQFLARQHARCVALGIALDLRVEQAPIVNPRPSWLQYDAFSPDMSDFESQDEREANTERAARAILQS
jgi:hypothetical protein